MKSFREYWDEGVAERGAAAPSFRAVSRVAPSRPRWGQLYLALGVIGAVGTAAHFMVHTAVPLEVVDAVFAFALFTALAGWVRLNRIGLTRLNEPDAGVGRPRLRVVRPRDHSAAEASAAAPRHGGV